jgi:hypothetical protein
MVRMTRLAETFTRASLGAGAAGFDDRERGALRTAWRAAQPVKPSAEAPRKLRRVRAVIQ